jgi:hypothetical protein
MEHVSVFPLDEGGARVLCALRVCRFRHGGMWYAVLDFGDGTPEVQTKSFDTMEGLQTEIGSLILARVRGT